MQPALRPPNASSDIALDRYKEVSSSINASPINKISWLLEQLQQSTPIPPKPQNLNIRVLPSVLVDLSDHTLPPAR